MAILVINRSVYCSTINENLDHKSYSLRVIYLLTDSMKLTSEARCKKDISYSYQTGSYLLLTRREPALQLS
uniref:Uncharacterized protein n=1 Tax=Lepeophtheirus salmonis TaxID=72036 RepID=A0A0K2UF96_LEPSM